MAPTLVLIALLALPSALASAAACRVMIAIGPLDAPDGGRKAQARAVPSSGGLAVAAAAALVFALVAGGERLQAPPDADWLARHGIGYGRLTVGLAFALGALAIGFADDLVGLPARAKFALLATLATGAAGFGASATALHGPTGAALALAAPLAAIGTALFYFVMMNAVNFMDGSNGLVAGALTPAFMALAALPVVDGGGFHSAGWAASATLVAALICLLGALAGFLVWNLAGRLYLGDAGALALGAGFAFAAVYSQRLSCVWDLNLSVWFAATLALPILVDVLLTLVWRARRGRNLLQAHRDHAYQGLILAGWPHWRVAALWFGLSCACAVSATLAALNGPAASFWAFWTLAALGSALWVWRRRALVPAQ